MSLIRYIIKIVAKKLHNHRRHNDVNKATYEEETRLIERLEATVPTYDTENEYGPNNTLYHQHITKIKDAYWRRRMLSAKPGECAP